MLQDDISSKGKSWVDSKSTISNILQQQLSLIPLNGVGCMDKLSL